EDMPSREGFTLISEHYPPGEIAPMQVILDTNGEEIEIKEELESHPGGEVVSDVEVGSKNSDLQIWELTLGIDPYSAAAVHSIPHIQRMAPDALNEVDIVKASS